MPAYSPNHAAPAPTTIEIKPDCSKLGSGNSAALNRIFDNVLKEDYTGFKFSTSNTLKDLTYIHEMLKDLGNAEKLADVKKSFYKKAVEDGNGDLFISELIQKD